VDRKQLSRRHFLKLTGGAVGVIAVAACTPFARRAGTTADDQPVVPAAETSALWVLHNEDLHPGYSQFIRAHIETYAAENDLALDVGYTGELAGTGPEIEKLAAAAQTGDAPDVWLGTTNVFQLFQAGALHPVSDLVAEVITQHGDVNPRPQAETRIQGDFYGVPLHVRSNGGWARRDVFEAAGIVIDEIRLYSDLAEACLAVSRPAAGFWGFGITVNSSGDGGWFIQRVLTGWGAQWVDETGERVLVDSPEMVAAVQWLADLYTDPAWEPMLPTDVLEWNDASNNEAYFTETIAYTQNAGTLYARAASDGLPVKDVTVFHPPCGGPVRQEFNGLGSLNCLHINGSQNLDHARGLILSFFDDRVMRGLYAHAETYALPAYRTMWHWDLIAGHPISSGLETVALDPSGYTGLAYPGPQTAQIGAVSTAALPVQMVLNVVTGQMTAAESVMNAHAESVRIFGEFGAAGA